MLERDLQHYFIKRVKEAGGLAYKVNCDGRRGFPDLVVILDCAIRLVEMKAKRGVLSHHQKRLHEELAEQGTTVTVIDSKQAADDFIKNWHYDPY